MSVLSIDLDSIRVNRADDMLNLTPTVPSLNIANDLATSFKKLMDEDQEVDVRACVTQRQYLRSSERKKEEGGYTFFSFFFFTHAYVHSPSEN